MGFGETLRIAREQRGLTLEDVSRQIKISEKQVRALEAEDFTQLPQLAFLRGFVRSYAKLLGLDATALLSALPSAITTQTTPSAKVVAVATPADVIKVASVLAPEVVPETAPAVADAAPVVVSEGMPEVEPETASVVLEVAPIVIPEVAPKVIPPIADIKVLAAQTKVTASAPHSTPSYAAPSIEAPFATSFAQRRRHNLIWLAAAIVCVIVAIVFAVWNMYAPAAPAQPAPELTSIPVPTQAPEVDVASGALSAPVMAGTMTSAVAATSATVVTSSGVAVMPLVTPASAVNANVALHLVFDEDSWTEIREQSGRVLTSQLNRAGTELRLDGTPPFTLIIGNATGVNLYYHGVEVDLEQHLPRPDSSIARFKLE